MHRGVVGTLTKEPGNTAFTKGVTTGEPKHKPAVGPAGTADNTLLQLEATRLRNRILGAKTTIHTFGYDQIQLLGGPVMNLRMVVQSNPMAASRSTPSIRENSDVDGQVIGRQKQSIGNGTAQQPEALVLCIEGVVKRVHTHVARRQTLAETRTLQPLPDETVRRINSSIEKSLQDAMTVVLFSGTDIPAVTHRVFDSHSAGVHVVPGGMIDETKGKLKGRSGRKIGSFGWMGPLSQSFQGQAVASEVGVYCGFLVGNQDARFVVLIVVDIVLVHTSGNTAATGRPKTEKSGVLWSLSTNKEKMKEPKSRARISEEDLSKYFSGAGYERLGELT